VKYISSTSAACSRRRASVVQRERYTCPDICAHIREHPTERSVNTPLEHVVCCCLRMVRGVVAAVRIQAGYAHSLILGHSICSGGGCISTSIRRAQKTDLQRRSRGGLPFNWFVCPRDTFGLLIAFSVRCETSSNTTKE